MTLGNKCNHGYDTEPVELEDDWKARKAKDCPLCDGDLACLPYREKP